MKSAIKRIIRKLFNVVGLSIIRASEYPLFAFSYYDYQRINQRRLEHLASLGLPITGSTVLDVGAGIGDHASFYSDRCCKVTISDARLTNIRILRNRFPDANVVRINLDNPPKAFNEVYDIVHCYGVLYHLKNPKKAIEFLAHRCTKMFLLETQVLFGNESLLKYVSEDIQNPTQSYSGIGCKPTRVWVFNQLKKFFEYVYMPKTQPNHEGFPINWSCPAVGKILPRAVFVASRQKLVNVLLVENIPIVQIRH